MSLDQDQTRDPTQPTAPNEVEEQGTAGGVKPKKNKLWEPDLQIKPACECKKCCHWTRDADWCAEHPEWKSGLLNIPFDDTELPPLVKTKRTEPYPRILKYAEAVNCGKVEEWTSPKLLVHGPDIPEFVKKIAETNLHQDVVELMNKFGYLHSTDMQSFSWPAFTRGLNMMLIGSHGCGKSMSYLPGLMSSSLDVSCREVDKYKGPLSLVICPDSATCEEIYARFLTVFSDLTSRVKIILMSAPITNVPSCDILITRASLLTEALQMRMFSLKRLCHLVIEEGYQVFSREKAYVYAVIKHCNEILAERNLKRHIQFIVTSTKWTADLKTVLKILYTSPLIIFENYLEAAIYGDIQMNFKFTLTRDKMNFVNFLVNGNYRRHRTLIFSSLNEIPLLSMLLRNRTIDVLEITEELHEDEMLKRHAIWDHAQYGHYKVLICTDMVFESFLHIMNAEWVIHYSLSVTWTRFIKRFRALRDNINSPLSPIENTERIFMTSILIDQSCTAELPRILDVMQHAGIKFSESLLKFVIDFNKQIEDRRVHEMVPLCQDIKMFGKCNVDMCPRRHKLTHKLDQFCKFTNAKKVRFHLIDVFDVTRYIVQITHEWNESGNLTVLNASSSDVTYPNIRRAKQATNPKIGGYYCELEGPSTRNGQFYLCKLLGLVVEEQVTVRLTMNNEERTISVSKLFEIPDDLFLCEVIMANLVPPFDDKMFSEKARHLTARELNRLRLKFSTFNGDVSLKLNRTMWLSNVVQVVPITKCDVIPFNLSERMIELKLADYSESQMESLYKLSLSGSILVDKPKLAKPTKHSMTLRKVQEAFISEQTTEVWISSAVDPYEFYVRLSKFDSLLRCLEKEATQYILNTEVDKVESPSIGGIYLTLDPRDINYCRAKLLKTDKDEGLVFFVDHGDEAIVRLSDLKPIPNRFKYSLPFQAIQCKLFGIAPCSQTWDEGAIDLLYKYMFFPDTDYFRPIYVKSIECDSGIGHTSRRYTVVMKDGCGKQRIINNILVDCGLAISYDYIPDFGIPLPLSESEIESEDSEGAQALSVSTEISEHCRPELQSNHIQVVKEAETVDDEGFFFDVPDANDFLSTYKEPVMSVYLFTEMEAKASNEGAATTLDPNATSAIANTQVVNGLDEASFKFDHPQGVLTPQILWTQFKDQRIRLRVMVSDVDTYDVQAEDSVFSCRVSCKDGREYSVKFNLFKSSELVRHTLRGDHIAVYLKKCEDVEWDQLSCAIAPRMRNVRYEFVDLSVSDRKKKFLDLGIPDSISKEVEETDNLMYLNESDVDSDYDEELPKGSSSSDD